MDQELVRAMEAFQQCIETRDRALAEHVLDDDYQLVLVVPSPATMLRERWIAVLPDYVIHEYVVEEQGVDVDADVAAVMHRVRMRATVLGADRSGTFVLTDIWRSRADGWRIWRRHSTPLSAGALPRA
jgi:hypothetical protein